MTCMLPLKKHICTMCNFEIWSAKLYNVQLWNLERKEHRSYAEFIYLKERRIMKEVQRFVLNSLSASKQELKLIEQVTTNKKENKVD